MTWDYFNIFLFIVTVLLALYYYIREKHNYWKARGVKGPTPWPVIGNIASVFFRKTPLADFLMEVYKGYKSEPLVGIYSGLQPILLVKDPAFIKNVLIKDFPLFNSRGMFGSDKIDAFANNIFRLEANRWRPLRAKLSPTFSSGKMKNMFYLLKQKADQFGQYLDHLVPEEKVLDCSHIMSKFTADVIGSCIFGIELNAITEDNCEFLNMGRKLMQPRLKVHIKELVRNWPWLFDLIGNFLVDHDITDYFMQTVMKTIDYRLKNNIIRHDFMDILTDLKKNPEQLPEMEVTEKIIVSQAVAFFIAGFFTSSTVMTHMLYELALNPHMQEKVRSEITEEFKKANGMLEYDSLKKLEYCDAVFKESLRKYPAVTHLLRQSLEEYTFPGTEVRIPKGQMIWIPVQALHLDPALYPDPLVFDPERFSKANEDLMNSMAYLAFGDGPRNCIGARFATYQSKIGVIEILRNFKVELCDKSAFKYGAQPRQFLLMSTEGTYLNFKKLSKD